MLNTEIKPQCNVKIALRLVCSVMAKKRLNVQNANKTLYYKKQPVKLNVIFSGQILEIVAFVSNVLRYKIVFSVLLLFFLNYNYR